jgi:hypothetical protein
VAADGESHEAPEDRHQLDQQGGHDEYRAHRARHPARSGRQ